MTPTDLPSPTLYITSVSTNPSVVAHAYPCGLSSSVFYGDMAWDDFDKAGEVFACAVSDTNTAKGDQSLWFKKTSEASIKSTGLLGMIFLASVLINVALWL
ncbi:hypothetical protein C7M61_005041 [Candidozyma pseudohaemuli]|uniref:Uncharacterized protein n=1 Tax=Candidozyma pseudohaemuli TaxID=418784 RepID=A0A2P7YCZ7_9ASCO|nr:hypothetical protein C7M61_005041 [[Candida] pseudohaemulonii]PSK33849.1 hypothetical protein C7M61_005041 [[Candida] pseudohaemulonii]